MTFFNSDLQLKAKDIGKSGWELQEAEIKIIYYHKREGEPGGSVIEPLFSGPSLSIGQQAPLAGHLGCIGLSLKEDLILIVKTSPFI